jgi:hypothetical protein
MSIRSFIPAFLLFSLSACDPAPADIDKNPEEEDDKNDDEALDGGGCVDEVTVLAGVEEASALGFSAADVLAVAAGSHASPMVWSGGLDDGPLNVAFGPEAGAGELTVGVTYNGGEVRFVKSVPEDNGYDGGFAECSDRLEVDVDVAVDSAGGGFAEQFTAPLRATSRGIGRISHEIALDAFAGSFAVDALEPDNAVVDEVMLEIGISGSGLFGGASMMVQIDDGEVVGAGFIPVASWPAADSACDFEAPIGLDAAVALFSGDDALALVAAAGPLSLQWAGAEPTEMTLALTPGAVACATDSGSEAGALRIPASAQVVTADGRWDGSFAVELYAAPAADGSLASVRLGVPAAYASTVDAAQFEASFGLADVDLSGFDGGGLDFSGEFTPAQGGATAHGQVTVLAVNHHMCSNEPGAPCEGDDIQELDMATWTNQ